MKGINTREALSEYMDNLHTEYAEEVEFEVWYGEGG